MLNYIQKELQKREEYNTAIPQRQTSSDDVENELIVEYSHLFQELDQVSVEGTDEDTVRKMDFDIPLEDDIEINTIELNIGDGRVTDIPMDAAVVESKYEKMKTFDDFYQEAVVHVSPLVRESDILLNNRRIAYANKAFTEYKAHIVQEGLFGFNKVSIEDERVPSNVIIDLGQISAKEDRPYYAKLPVTFEIDNKSRVLKKQIDSINSAQYRNAFKSIGEAIVSTESKEGLCKPDDFAWDVFTPKALHIPVDPIDSFVVCFIYTDDKTDNEHVLTWKLPISTTNYRRDKTIEFTPSKTIDKSKMMSKSTAQSINESYKPKKISRFESYYQEAIDFGDEAQDPPTPSTDMGEQPSTDNNEAEPTALPVETNDVSSQIAEKISNDNDPDSSASSLEATPIDGPPVDDTETIDGGGEDTQSMDTDIDATSTDASSDIEGLDESGNTDLELDESGDVEIDVNNMTIDQLLENGADKLKGMTIQQLKEFLSGDPATIQEAFFLTKKNINEEIDIHLRTALGILNDTEMSLKELITAFKAEGKKLNKVLSKACKMKKVYTSDEIISLQKLNHCLSDLITTLKESTSENDTVVVKRLVQAFVSDSVVVSKIIEGKKTPSTDNDTNIKNKKVY